MTELIITGLSKSFGPNTVLREVDLNVASGSLVAILGPSGSGKTTLLRLVCGFERADGGTIRIGDDIVSERSRHVAPEQRHVGYVAQEGGLFPHLSVADNIVFGLPRSQRKARHRVAELLELVGLPASYADRAPQALSGGEQQRISVARALAPSPGLVLLDEPFSSLDAGLRAETRQAVASALAAVGATALLVTHDQPEALSMGHRVAVLWGGRLVQIASPETLYRLPADPALAQFVGEAVLLPGTVRAGVATCSLGELALAAPVADGPVEVLLRPEQIRLTAAHNAASGIHARVREVNYYGHDASVNLTLNDGNVATPIIARVPGYDSPHPGDAVLLSVEGAVFAYPRRPAH
ncbi:MAG TPA: ABC transporter ATP-binding protein [Dongiaceae bacterium]